MCWELRSIFAFSANLLTKRLKNKFLLVNNVSVCLNPCQNISLVVILTGLYFKKKYSETESLLGTVFKYFQPVVRVSEFLSYKDKLVAISAMQSNKRVQIPSNQGLIFRVTDPQVHLLPFGQNWNRLSLSYHSDVNPENYPFQKY